MCNAIEINNSMVILTKSIVIHLDYSFGNIHIMVNVYGTKTQLLTICETFTYAHADRIHNHITKSLLLVEREVKLLIHG